MAECINAVFCLQKYKPQIGQNKLKRELICDNELLTFVIITTTQIGFPIIFPSFHLFYAEELKTHEISHVYIA